MAKREVEVDVKSKGAADLARDLRDAAKAAKEAAAELKKLQSTPVQSEAVKSALRAGKTPTQSSTAASTKTAKESSLPFGATREEIGLLSGQGRRAARQHRSILQEQRTAQQARDRDARRAEQDRKQAQRDEDRASRDAMFARESRLRIFTPQERREMKAASGPQTGPMQRLAEAHRELARAEASDDPLRIFDAKTRVKTAQTAVQNAEARLSGSDITTRLGQILTSLRLRIGAGGGGGGAGGAGGGMFGSVLVAPLIRSLANAGAAAGIPAAATGGAAVAVTAAVIGLKVFADEVEKATATVRAFTSAQTLSGGTSAEVARLTSIGMNPAGLAGVAAQFRERLSRDPFAVYTAASLGGGYRMPRPYGSANETTDLMNVLESLRQVKDAEEQLRMARMMGLETSLELIRVSDRVWESMKRDADVRSKILDNSTQQSFRDLAGESERVKNNFDALRESMMKAVAPTVTNGLENLADVLQGAASTANKNPTGTGAIIGAIVGLFTPLGPLGGAILGGMAGDKARRSAMEENTKAIQENTKAQMASAYLLIHGFQTPAQGSRSRVVLPEAFSHNPIAMRHWLEGQTAGSGAYRY